VTKLHVSCPECDATLNLQHVSSEFHLWLQSSDAARFDSVAVRLVGFHRFCRLAAPDPAPRSVPIYRANQENLWRPIRNAYTGENELGIKCEHKTIKACLTQVNEPFIAWAQSKWWLPFPAQG
jgi:hypothetical protein